MNIEKIELKLSERLQEMPVIAILRGVRPDEVVAVAEIIYQQGISIIEVPLNTPNAFDCIANLSNAMGDCCLVGCGTLTNSHDISKLVDSGAQIAVTPSTQPNIIEDCLKHGLMPIPGFLTPTEAFAAIHAGARYLKLFPASTVGRSHLAALKAVLPRGINVLAVGGVKHDELDEWIKVGAAGFGFASDIFHPGDSIESVKQAIQKLVASVRKAGVI